LRSAGESPPDLVLLDVMMPGMDGFETCRRLRGDPILAEVPVILLTALDDRESRLAGFEAGADDFVAKPFDRLELRLRVRGLLRLNRYRRLTEERARADKQEAALSQTEKLAAMGSLLAGVAHELNNPLAVIIGSASLLLNRSLVEKDAKRVGTILAAGERCARIVKNFLALARQRPHQRFEVQLNSVVVEALEMLAHQLRANGVVVTTKLDPDLPPLWADGHRLHQVVVNLVSNAEQAMRDVTTRNLLVSTRLDDGQAVLEVSDSGPGVPEEVRSRVFEPFFTTKEGRSFGLGLSTCYGIVRQAGGAISVTSAPGAGATFRVHLPRTTAARPVAASEVAEPKTTRGTETVIIVEDEPSVRRIAVRALSSLGYRVLEAETRAAAEALFGDHVGPIEAAILDVALPDGNGRDVAATLARTRPQSRVLFVSGYAGDLAGPHGVLDPSVAFLPKPYTPEQLARRLRALLDSDAATT
jgi:signal transduction histidine kinase